MIKPLTKKEKKEMADFALLVAMSKASTLSTVGALLYAAVRHIESFQSCHNSYTGDPELESFRKEILKVHDKAPRGIPYGERIAEAVGGAEVGAFDYGSPHDEYELRLRNVGQDPDDEGVVEDFEMLWVDPIDMYKQKSGKGAD